MRNETRLLFTAYVSQIALLNGVADATTKFSISPAVEQKLEEKIQESSDFLSEINIVGVPQQSGDKVGVTVTRPDRKSVVQGKSVSVRVDLGGRRLINKKKQKKQQLNTNR